MGLSTYNSCQFWGFNCLIDTKILLILVVKVILSKLFIPLQSTAEPSRWQSSKVDLEPTFFITTSESAVATVSGRTVVLFYRLGQPQPWILSCVWFTACSSIKCLNKCFLPPPPPRLYANTVLPYLVGGKKNAKINTEGGYCFVLWSGHLGCSGCHILLYILDAIHVKSLKLKLCFIHKKCISQKSLLLFLAN